MILYVFYFVRLCFVNLFIMHMNEWEGQRNEHVVQQFCIE